jgi:hypothetical protein
VIDPGLLAVAATSALATGATGSLHCALMCGPLACATAQEGGQGWWHLGRLTAYASVGAALGALGQGVSIALRFSIQPYLPWLMIAGLLMTAFDVGRRVRLPGAATALDRLARVAKRAPLAARGFAFGALTPLLPCGLLYGMFLAALATGTAWGGALVMASFGVGAVPLLAVAIAGHRKLAGRTLFSVPIKTLVPLAAASVLAVRTLLARASTPACP